MHLTKTESSHDVAARVLRNEGAALLTMADAVPAAFDAVVQAILPMKGRVILSGIGKSGHIARKIAATLASTGTPAMFVHPSEASHGDLGMVMPDDLCILLSNSGETAELNDLTLHCRRFSIPLVAITSRKGSALTRAADFSLVLPNLPEACAIGLAPTTSTTLMLGLGDALAVALMEARKFQATQFAAFHPGGRLGAQLTLVAQVMHSGEKVPLVALLTPMSEVILAMTSGGFGVAGVLDENGVLTGAISDGDLRRKMDGLMSRTAAEVCTRNPIFVTPETLAVEALGIMTNAKVGAIFVCEGKSPVGILHLHDLLRIGVV